MPVAVRLRLISKFAAAFVSLGRALDTQAASASHSSVDLEEGAWEEVIPAPRVNAPVKVEVEVLMVTRRSRPTKGTWAPPRGSIDWEIDESVPEAALRHFLTQTGLEKSDIVPVPSSLCVVENIPKKTRKCPSGTRRSVFFIA